MLSWFFEKSMYSIGDFHEFHRVNREFRVKVKVLWVAERRQHAAEIRRDVLHDERERQMLFIARRWQHEIAQRQKRQQRHVVGDKHGADERDVRQRQNACPRRSK